MKKMLSLIFIASVITTLGHSEACAQSAVYEAYSVLGLSEFNESLDTETREISGEITSDGLYDAEGALKKLLNKLVSDARDAIRGNISSVVGLIGISLLTSCASCFVSDKASQSYINIAGVCAAAYMLTGGMEGLVEQSMQALLKIEDYSRAAIPAVFTAAVTCGAVVSASSKYAAVTIAIDVLMGLAQSVLIPLVYAYLALSLSSAVFDNAILNSCKRAVKWICGTSLTVFTMVFSAFMGISGLVSGTADALAVKTARTVISTALPVVGGIISDAASTVLTAATMIKNSAGVMSLIAVCTMCAGPFVLLSIKMLMYKATAAACEMLPNLRLSVFIKDVGTALGMLMGLLGCSAIMLFISFMAAIKVVTI